MTDATPRGAEPGRAPLPAASEGRWVASLLALALGIGLLALLLFLLVPLAPSPPDLAEVQRQIAVDAVENSAGSLRPEPLERFLYISGVLLLPFCLGGAYLLVRRLLLKGPERPALRRLRPATLWLVAAALPALLVAAGRAEGHSEIGYFLPGGWLSLAAAAALALGASTASARSLAERAGRLPWALSGIGVGSLLLVALALAAFREEHIRNIPIFWASFNAIFYSVVQVCFGRELTVDFINQYGLYPHFLEPLFSVVGLSVFSFTMVMGLLNCVSFACFYLFLARETRSALLAFLGTASVFFFCYAYGKAAPDADQYFQYNPLRTLFPALLLALALSFAHKPRPWLSAAFGALGMAAALWVPDVGVIVLASALLFLAYDALARRRPREIPVRLLQAAAAAAATLLLFGLLLRLRFGAFPDYSKFFLYPKAFYLYGNLMLPMPPFGLWVPVLLTYAAGLLRSLIALIEKEDRPRDRLYFLLPVLGLGLFLYYQGRSVVWNLVAAAYPAVLLLALFTAELRQSAPRSGWPAPRVLLVTLLTLLCFSVPAVAVIAPGWGRNVSRKVAESRRGANTDVLRDARFLQKYVQPGEKVLIISYQSGLFHLLTRTTNPLDIPGDSELMYRADFDKQSDYAFSRRGKVVVDKTTMGGGFVSNVRRYYPNRVENPAGNLMVLQVP